MHTLMGKVNMLVTGTIDGSSTRAKFQNSYVLPNQPFVFTEMVRMIWLCNFSGMLMQKEVKMHFNA